jgi:serine/threonine protein kinase
MGSNVSIAAAIVVAGIVVFGIALSIILYRKRIFKKNVVAAPKRKAAFSLGGNFVEDLNVPIETKYFVTKNVLGSGSSAQVVVGENKRNKRKYAIKVIDLSRHEVAWRYEREKNFLRDIDHTNVIRLYEVYSSKTALYFVMELCTGGHLGQVLRASPLGRLDEEVAMQYVLQLTRAIGHCHHHGICHRDVKLQNILLESSSKEAQVKLVDFGNGARFRNNLPLTKVVGTTYTAAPEVFRECYDERCDVWSLGVVTYILLSGKRPFEKIEVPASAAEPNNAYCAYNNNRKGGAGGNGGGAGGGGGGGGHVKKEESVVASILLGRYHFAHDVFEEEVSDEAINFIKHCFVMDYTKRKSAGEMLEHPWLSDEFEGNILLPSDKIRRISLNSSDTLRKTMGRELLAPFSGIRHISMLAVAFARPTERVQLLRKVFQEIDYNGNGTIGS